MHQEKVLDSIHNYSYTSLLVECLRHNEAIVVIAAKKALIQLYRYISLIFEMGTCTDFGPGIQKTVTRMNSSPNSDSVRSLSRSWRTS